MDDCKVVRFFGAVIKPVHPCTGLIARFAQQNALLLRTTDIRVGTEKKTPREQSSSGKKIGAESAVLHFVFFEVIVNKMQQSVKERCLLKRNAVPEVFPLTAILAGSGKTVPFEKRRSRYKETAENKAEAYLVYVEHLFSAYDAVDARIFSKGDGETIIYTYDKGGQLKGVSGVKNTVKGTENYSYIDTIVYDEHGQRVYIKYGNGVETKYRYDDKRRWLKDIETKNRQTDEIFQKISYRFDKVGNVLGYSNDASVYETSQNYTYGSLYQLIGVEGTSNQYKAIKSFGSTPVNVAKYKQDFAFDGIGNMTRKASTTNLPGARGNASPNAELDYSLDYEYDSAYAHRLVRAGNRYYRYDANGNITAEKDGPFTEDDEFIFTYSYDPETDVYGTDYGFGLDAPKETEESHPENLFAYRRNYTWNEKNLLTKSSDRTYTVHYRYGEDGQRALKYTEEGRSETLYFNNFYTIHIPVQDKNNPQGLRVHKHIFVGNSRLVTAMTHTDNNGDNAEQREKRYYYHSDHLGSAQFVTDWRGRQYEHIEYTPYGELWIEEVAAGLDKLPFRFTGKEMDEETGLYYYGARYLDPKYSRWLSGDPALGDYIPTAGTDPSRLAGMGGVYNTVNLHLYHYAGNNPVKYTDPTGMFDDISESCKNFMKNYEGGFHPKIYDAEDPSNEYKKGKASDWTIGYGHKLTANDLSSGIYDNGIKKDDASKLFDKDLKSSVDAVNRDLPNADKLTQNQFDALVDFTYNIGSGDGFKNSKVKVAVEKYGDKIANSETMQTDDYKINIADVFRHHIPPRTSPINKGIKNRRYNEVQMFLYGDYQRDDTPPGIASGWQEGIKI